MQSYTVTYDLNLAKLKIETSASNGSNFTIFGDQGMASHWNVSAPANLRTNDPRSANKVCGFQSLLELTGSTNNPLIASDIIDVQRNHVVYLHSSLTMPGDSYGPRGESGVLRKVIIEAPQNGLAIDRHTTAYDFIEIPAQPLRSMHFSLHASDGSLLDLHGHHWSFSLVIHPKQ